VVGDGTKREDICLCASFTAAECLGSEIDFCRVAEMIVDMACARRDRNGGLASFGTGSNLPIHDLKAGLSLGYAVDQHILGRQAAMIQTLAVSLP
jgi:hypothetical protein